MKRNDLSYLLIIGLVLPFFAIRLFPEKKKFKRVDYPKYCNYTDDYYRGSTKRDVLILSADSFSPGLELAIKTFRSTGCQARIIILTSKSFYLPPRVPKIFDNLGVELITNCTENKGRQYIPHMLRFEYELKWLTEHKSEVDRVFHCDAFDVLFQKDPFSPEIKKDRLLFAVEPHCVQQCGWNLAWISHCFNQSVTKWISPYFIICSGSIIGGVEPYIKLLNLMINLEEWDKCYGNSIDQPILNFVVWSGAARRAGILYDLTGCNGNFMTMQWCMLDHSIRLNDNQQIISFDDTLPAFVHQYNRVESITSLYYQKCHVFPVPLNYSHNA